MNETMQHADNQSIKMGGMEHRLWWIIGILLAIGLMMTFDLGYSPLSGDTYTTYLLNIGKFIALAVIGLFFAILLRKASPRSLTIAAHVLMIIAIVLLIYTAKYGIVVNHARRWVGFWGITFQTSEFFKFALMLGLADALAPLNVASKLEKFKTIAWKCAFLIELAAGVALIFKQPNHSAAVVISLAVFFIALLSKVKWQYVLTVGLIALICLAILIMRDPEKRDRILAFFHKSSKEKQTVKLSEERFQAEQAGKAVRAAGIIRFGPGTSKFKQSIPAAGSDFIFAVFVEEMGLIGGLILLGCYFVLVLSAFEVIISEKDEFLKLMGVGMILILTFNVLLHVAVNLDLLPTTGVPLPFVSQGGSALLMNIISIGLILNLARRRDSEKPPIVIPSS